MGQKVNPHGIRVGVIKDWDSRWFTSKKEFGDTLVEDYKIRKTLKKQLFGAGIPKIEIERTVDNQSGAPKLKVNIFCAKPGMVIGKGGSEITKLQEQLAKMTGKAVNVKMCIRDSYRNITMEFSGLADVDAAEAALRSR